MAQRKKPRARRPDATAPVPRGSIVGRLPASLAATWVIAVIVEIALHATTTPAGVVTSFAERTALVGTSLLAIFVSLCGVGIVLVGLGRLERGGAALRWLAFAARAGLIWIAVLLYVSSWAVYWNTGLFLDGGAVNFWLSQPVQVFHWVYPPLVAGLLAITFAAAGLVTWIHHRSPGWSLVVRARLVQATVATVAICAALLIVQTAVYGWAGVGVMASPYSTSRSAPAGPLVHLLLQWQQSPPAAAEAPAPPQNTQATGDEFSVTRRPIVSMQQYLAGVRAGQMRRLNVVMVQVESLRADQLRVYGGMRDVMPGLDALARESRVFGNAYVQASHSNYTDPVPLSSHYPLRAPEMINSYPENPTYPRVLIYDVLKALGYKTAIFSSQNENWGGMINYHRPDSLDRLFHAATFSGPTYTPWEDSGFAEWVKQTEGAGSVDDRYTVDEAIKWIDEVASQPFFIHMNLQSSHLPYVVPAGFKRPFGPASLDFAIMWDKFPVERVNTVKDRYADSLYYVDLQMTRLFNHLRQTGLIDRTVIVVGGDNGEAFFEHGFAAHASWLFNEVMKVPMIIRAPGLEPRVDDRPAMFLDVPPSVFSLLGLPTHPSFQGISLFDPNPNPDRSVYMIVQTPAAYETAIVRSGFKLHFVEKEGIYALNDLVNDPGETKDVVRSHLDLLKTLGRRLHRWRKEQLDYYADTARQQREYPPVLED